MIGEIAQEVIEALVEAAIELAQYVEMVEVVVHEGPPARFIAFCPKSKAITGFTVDTGESIAIYRGHRLLVEPIDSVRLKAPDDMVRAWSIS